MGDLGLFRDIARAATEKDLADVVMDRAEPLFGAHVSGFCALADGGRPSQVQVRGLCDRFVDCYEQEGRDIDPLLAWVGRNHAPTHSSHVLPQHGWIDSELYKRVASRWGIERYLLVPILVEGELMGTLSFGRGLSRDAFAEIDLVKAAALSAHVSSRMTALRLVDATRWQSVLTSRELDVAEMVGKGLTNAEIGTLLGISPNTVKKALKNTFDKLGCARRAELAAILSSKPAR